MAKPTALVYDPTARFTHVAEALARDCKVLYAVQQRVGFPQPLDYMPGQGLDGITVVEDLFGHVAEADFAVFTDVGDCAMQEYLRQQLPVCGSGAGGILELDRWLLRSEAAKYGINVPTGLEVKGINELRKVLRKQEDVFVKLSRFRGVMETFHHVTWVATEAKLALVEARLGPLAQEAEFVVEQPIDDAAEIGFDTFCVRGDFPRSLCWGIEAKDACYANTLAPLNEHMRTELANLGRMLAAYDYMGPVCTEYRINKDGCWLIDLTTRFGSPPSQLQACLLRNYADVLYDVAEGKVPKPEQRAPYGVQINLLSEQFQHGTLAIEVADPASVAIMGHCRIREQEWAVNTQAHIVDNLTEFGAACGWGRNMESALENALDVADSVSGLYVAYNKGKLAEVMEEIRKAERLGLRWGATV